MSASATEMPRWTPGEARELAARDDDSAGRFPVSAADADVADIARVDRQIGGIVQYVRVPVYLRRAVLDQLEEREAIARGRRVRRRFAMGMTAAAASLLLAAVLLPGPTGTALDSETVAFAASEILNAPDGGEWRPLDRGQWPGVMNVDLAVGQRDVEFLGRDVVAYQLVSGHLKATLLVVPKSALPPKLHARQRVSLSTRQLDVHFIPSHDVICVLVVPAGAGAQRFETASGVA